MTKLRYLELRKALLATVAPFKPQIRVRRYPLFRATDKYGVSGLYEPTTQRITLKIYGHQSYTLQLLTLAHEVRHLQHHQQGLFKEYYLNHPEIIREILEGRHPLPDKDLAWDAETDCNLYARNWLAQQGERIDYAKISYRGFLNYPYEATWAAQVHRDLRRRQKSGINLTQTI